MPSPRIVAVTRIIPDAGMASLREAETAGAIDLRVWEKSCRRPPLNSRPCCAGPKARSPW